MNNKTMEEELKVIQKTYDYIAWVNPLINKLPRNVKFGLGDRFLNRLYDTLEELIKAKYKRGHEKLENLNKANVNLEIVRFYQRLLKDGKHWDIKRYKYSSSNINEIGINIGNWIKSIK